MKKIKILAIASFSLLVSTNINANIEFGGTCVSWELYPGYDVITCQASNETCFGIDTNGDLYFPDLKTSHNVVGAPIEIESGVWKLKLE